MISTAINRGGCGKLSKTPHFTDLFPFSTDDGFIGQQVLDLVSVYNSSSYDVFPRTNSTTSTAAINYLLNQE